MSIQVSTAEPESQVTNNVIRNLRSFHLLGAMGQTRTEMLHGREHLVVPVVALMEGVIHPVNAETPEMVPLSVLQKAASTWNGRPVCLGHPVKNGRQCSANAPDILASHGIGTIFNAHVEGKKLLCEAWIDSEKARRLHPDMYNRLLAGKTEEVSVGAYVVTDPTAGQFNGKAFKAMWLETVGDHLAFLPGGRGACSVAMGCGTHRAAGAYLVTASAFEALPDRPMASIFSSLEGEALDERMRAVQMAIAEKYKTSMAVEQTYPSAYVVQIFDDRVIIQTQDGETLAVDYDMENGNAVLGNETKVKQAWVAAAGQQVDCEACDGSGQKDGKDCQVCDGLGQVRAAEMKVLIGSRHSQADMRIIQGMHDHAVTLGAACDRTNYTILRARKIALRTATIRNEGGKWVLYTKDGSKKLGTHDTKAEAEAQEQAIEVAKARRAAQLAASAEGGKHAGQSSASH